MCTITQMLGNIIGLNELIMVISSLPGRVCCVIYVVGTICRLYVVEVHVLLYDMDAVADIIV